MEKTDGDACELKVQLVQSDILGTLLGLKQTQHSEDFANLAFCSTEPANMN